MNAALSLQQAMRAALIARSPLTALLGGAHIFDEVPRGANPPYVLFTGIETRDWSVADQKAHEHFVSLEIVTNSRSRGLAQSIAQEIETALDMMPIALVDHKLVNLRNIFINILRSVKTDNYVGTLRFRAATEPN
jgi:Protein of unknown function (DUF3168)